MAAKPSLRNVHNSVSWRAVRLAITVLGIIACVAGMWSAWIAGASRTLTNYGLLTNSFDAADRAVQLSPSDPEAHSTRAALLANKSDFSEASRESERAVALRPRDYVLWVELGRARDQADDQEGALIAFTEAIRLAPYYAQPRWQLGNLLFRMGRRDEAFRELRRAVESDPALLLNLIDLAWGATRDAKSVVAIIRPQTKSWRLELARFLVKHGQTAEGIELYRAAGNITEEERRTLLTELLTAKRFTEAYEVWLSSAKVDGGLSLGRAGVLIDGSFEGRISLNEPGFGWQMGPAVPAVRISFDKEAARAGTQCLRLEFNGESTPAAPVLSQLVLVEPNTRYRLRFAARTQEIVTGGLPVIVVADASDVAAHRLAQSATLPPGTSQWQDYTVEFMTEKAVSAVIISLQRQNCSSAPCPIFGRLWLDEFSLQKL